jgi:hypothetical protein
MSDAGSSALDSRGAYAEPRYINDLDSTTKFHPSELPANPDVIKRFPKKLIDINQVTESPGSDADPENRLEAAGRSFLEHAHRFGGVEKMKEFMVEMFGGNSAPAEAPAEIEQLPEGQVAEPEPIAGDTQNDDGLVTSPGTGVPMTESEPGNDAPPPQ